MGLVTVFWPLTTTGVGELVLQTAGEARLVVDCKVNPTALVGHVKMTLVPEGMMVSCAGDENGFVGSVLMVVVHTIAVRVGSIGRGIDGQIELLEPGVGDR